MNPETVNPETVTPEQATSETVKVTLVRSLIGVKKDHRATVRALGLKKTGDSRDVKTSPDVQGMVHKVSYLLKVEGRS